jgi:hypothetical protein
MSFPKNVCHVTADSAHYRVVGDLEMKMVSWCFFFRSESHCLVTSSAAAMRGKAPPPCSRLRNARRARGSPTRSCGSEHRPSASHSEETPGNIVKGQPVTRKDRVSCEVNSIGATGVKPPLLVWTTICIGTRTVQPAQSQIKNGSDYAGLPSSLLWPCQIFSTTDGQIQKEKVGKILLIRSR